MKITIELDLNEVRVLGNWASVLRTLNNGQAVAEGSGELETWLDEIADLKGPLSELHRKVRNQIWEAWSIPRDEAIYDYCRGLKTKEQVVEKLCALGWYKWKVLEMLENLPK